MAKKTAKKKAAPKKAAAKKTATKKTETKKAEPKKKAAAKKKTTKRTKAAKEVRLKAYWGVFNQSLRRVALFEFNEKKQAEKKAQDLTKSGKSPHFVQPVKEAIDS
ncbi:MAG: hypothetical protein AAGA92_04350 [Planctomycetota bacterium]